MKLIDRHLPDGVPLRVRLPHARDHSGLADLHLRLGLETDDLELARALRFHPDRETVLCATAWIDGRETLVGYARGERERPRARTVLADEALAPGTWDALEGGLVRRGAAA